MPTIHVVSHTHWDREWYLPFQLFRLKLVQAVDGLLDILAHEPTYRHFMLDGQTIILEDYLQMRPQRTAELRAHVQEGRLTIGPWYVLADEFLVSPEALVRNLFEGRRTAAQFGSAMEVGYAPDTFGHIAQLPQILRGFGIASAALQRGLADEPCELWWMAPDGSRVLLAFLREGYGNAAHLPVISPTDSPATTSLADEVARLRDVLAPHSATGHLLLMQGTDHATPLRNTGRALQHAAGQLLSDNLLHSTLRDYLAAVQTALHGQEDTLPTVAGELRNPRRFHLLPGVLSARIWIKQRNHACETLLEQWAEPFSACAGLLAALLSLPGPAPLADPAQLLRQAWRLLMQCHPHDSICGCSVDQVHEEMRTRFDQVEQIGLEITRQSLRSVAAAIDTQPPDGTNPTCAVVVFNPTASLQAGIVYAEVPGPPGPQGFIGFDEQGQPVPCRLLRVRRQEMLNQVLDREELFALFANTQTALPGGLNLAAVGFRREDHALHISVRLAELEAAHPEALDEIGAQAMAVMEDESLTSFVIEAYVEHSDLELLAGDVPGYGYRTFWLAPAAVRSHPEGLTVSAAAVNVIENEYLRVEADSSGATLTVTDKRTGMLYQGLNRLVDGGDCGDLYNYCPPVRDTLVTLGDSGAGLANISLYRDALESTLEMRYTLPVPAALAADRRSRAGAASLHVRTQARLLPGVPRVDITTGIENLAADHRLRVHFPAPFGVTGGDHDGHYAVIRRPAGAAGARPTWAEDPRPEVPQRLWTSISDGNHGLTVAALGLPEVEVIPGTSEIALTLLRCIGWLSRSDLTTRRGHAGPPEATPGAQLQGTHRFEYAIIPHAGDWLSTRAYARAQAFNAPPRGVVVAAKDGPLPAHGSFLRANPPEFVITALKAPEEGAGTIVRGFNITDQPLAVLLQPATKFKKTTRVRLDEEVLAELATDEDGAVTFDVAPHEVVTIRFE